MAAQSDFQVVHVNIRGVRANKENLIHYLESMNYPEIVTLNETKLGICQSFSLPNYDVVVRKERRGGQHGSMILKRCDVTDVSIISETNQFYEEIIGARLNGNQSRPTINVLCYYNPPNMSTNENIIRFCRQLKGRTVLTGDLNCKHVSWGSTKNDQQGISLLKAVNDYRLFILNNGGKTRYDPSTGKEQALDLTISNGDMMDNFVSWNVDGDIGSDHYPIRSCFAITRNASSTSDTFRNVNNTDWEHFQASLSNLSVDKPRNANELDEAVSMITTAIMNAFEEACPLKKRRWKKSMAFSKDMIALVKEKRRLRREKAFAKRHGDDISVAELQKLINRKNNELKKEQRARQKLQIKQQCTELNREKNSARFFQLFDRIRGKEKQNVVTGSVSDNGNTAKTDAEKANLFAKRLEQLHQTREDDAFSPEWKRNIESYVEENRSTFIPEKTEAYSQAEPGDDNPLMSRISIEEVKTQLQKCKNRSAPGEDGLTYLMLKKLPENLFHVITGLFNVSLSLGYFPTSWKSATIKMMPKPGKDSKEAKNWRPISLISCLAKLYERVVTARLSSYLEEKKLLSQTQSGFRKGRMTAEQLFRLAEDSFTSIKKKGITAALFLDAEAAFDQAWHDAIRYKLDKIGLPKRFVRLISSFLSDRSLQVNVGSEKSHRVTMKAGTPQGSCLSPLLYIILVNDIPQNDNASVGQFADDICLWTNAYSFRGSQNRLQKAVNELESWCRKWRIKLNGSKSNLIFFNRLNEDNSSEDLSIQLFNDIVRPCMTSKYLGILLDTRLKFHNHFQDVEARATSRLNLFKLLAKNGVDGKTMIRLYKTYVRPLFEYGSIAFLAADIKRLQKVQNHFIRISLKIPSYIRTDLIHEAAGLELLEKRLLYLNCKLLRKMMVQDVINLTVQESRNTVALNNYKSPLDLLMYHFTD